ncbi:hypothetical protein HHI36_021540 [Cryptolaemus montrouzieri]|uniref:Reverse transcriptase domain-containing protein n=1 Tax=Cryptolaemus montrouzieri TaxID=559131 RepID=A0ABD2MXX3_9CUCU
MSYLLNRRFITRIQDQKSTAKRIGASVPQGSVLGPLQVNVYIADIPKMKHSKMAQFADDTTIYASHRNKAAVRKWLQDIDQLTNYFKRWGIKVNPKKTVATYIDHKKMRHTKTPKEINIEGQRIE